MTDDLFVIEEKYAVAIREDGMFYAQEESFGSTTPHFVDNPIKALKVFPRNKEDPLSHPSYYITGPYSVSFALAKCRMVWVGARTEAEIIDP